MLAQVLFVVSLLHSVQSAPNQAYKTVGCYADRQNRAIPTLEGKDPLLNGRYWSRINSIEKCFQAAKRRGFRVFAVQNGGWCASSVTAENTLDKYGPSSACKSDGKGGPWANQVYYIKGFMSVGCYKDTHNRAIRTLEGRDSILDGSYGARQFAIAKCALAAKRAGFSVFAVQNGGWCAGSVTAEKTLNKYGPSSACKPDGEGGPWANQAYAFKDYTSVGCYKDTHIRAIPTLEGGDSILDGSYGARHFAIAKCALAARRAGFSMFAVQNGGWCAGSVTAEKTFNKYGPSSSCKPDGEGGPWANHVYTIKDSSFEKVGCYKDNSARAIPSLEGHDSLLDGSSYILRADAVAKCAAAARKRHFTMFAVQNGGWCAGSATAENTFNKYGRSSACKSDGEGGGWANQVYSIKDYKSLGCHKDTSVRAIPTLEGTDGILDGNYVSRQDSIAKCAVVARKRGFRVFAVQNGGWCAGSANAANTYDKYGPSSHCRSDGEGGPWANEVYSFY